MKLAELERDFETIAACPICQGALLLEGERLTCRGCAQVYSRENGIWRFLLSEQQTQYQPFLDVYHQLRRGDGWERQSDTYYLNLPNVAEDDPQAPIWRIRCRSFMLLKQSLMSWQTGWALDLGAGNCWLTHHLSRAGYQVLALDINTEGRDGLAGGSVYLEQRASVFLRGQASMEQLPVRSEQIDLCLISGALHYVDAQATLMNIFAVLRPGGHLVIMDSPVYHEKASGMQMMREQLARFKSQYGITELSVAGNGYLVFDAIMTLLAQVGFQTTVVWPEHSGARFIREVVRRAKRRRAEARFPLLLAIKPPGKR